MNNNHRFDVRSKKEFIKDIKSSHIKEAEIAVRLCIVEHSKTGKWPALKPNGVDFSGTYIDNPKQITSDPDFKIDDTLIEITRSDKECQRIFHEKCHKVERCIKEGFDLVFVNGLCQFKQPNFIRLNSKQLEEFTIRSKSKYSNILHPSRSGHVSTNKPAFRYDTFWFQDLWQRLPALCKDIPEDYKNILKMTKV